MSDFETEGFYDHDWDECGDLAWNEFDWERYLRGQDDILHRYLAYYERLRGRPDRIDAVAHLMGWDAALDGADDDEAGGSRTSGGDPSADPTPGAQGAPEPYTLHKNPVFVATRAIYLSLNRSWEGLAGDGVRVATPGALAIQASLHRGEQHAWLGVQALDIGDYALSVSLFKRALRELNRTLALTDDPKASRSQADWRRDALPRLFDLREIWLRVISECREELERRVDDEG